MEADRAIAIASCIAKIQDSVLHNIDTSQVDILFSSINTEFTVVKL